MYSVYNNTQVTCNKLQAHFLSLPHLRSLTQIRNYWLCHFTAGEIKVLEVYMNCANYGVRKELELETTCLIFPLQLFQLGGNNS